MNNTISQKIKQLIGIAEKAQTLYNSGETFNGMNELDNIVDLIEDIKNDLSNEPVSQNYWDSLMIEIENSPKIGHLPLKNISK